MPSPNELMRRYLAPTAVILGLGSLTAAAAAATTPNPAKLGQYIEHNTPGPQNNPVLRGNLPGGQPLVMSVGVKAAHPDDVTSLKLRFNDVRPPGSHSGPEDLTFSFIKRGTAWEASQSALYLNSDETNLIKTSSLDPNQVFNHIYDLASHYVHLALPR